LRLLSRGYSVVELRLYGGISDVVLVFGFQAVGCIGAQYVSCGWVCRMPRLGAGGAEMYDGHDVICIDKCHVNLYSPPLQLLQHFLETAK
jgi:hypothetical protein